MNIHINSKVSCICTYQNNTNLSLIMHRHIGRYYRECHIVYVLTICEPILDMKSIDSSSGNPYKLHYIFAYCAYRFNRSYVNLIR